MDMTNRRNTTYVSGNTHPPTQRTYNFLLRLSRRLGSVAAYSSFTIDLKTFMNNTGAHKVGGIPFLRRHIWGTLRQMMLRGYEKMKIEMKN